MSDNGVPPRNSGDKAASKRCKYCAEHNAPDEEIDICVVQQSLLSIPVGKACADDGALFVF
jgi:hypothetical protein